MSGIDSGYNPKVLNPNKVFKQMTSGSFQKPFYFGGSQRPYDLGVRSRGSGIWDWADPNKNGVARAFDPKQNGVTAGAEKAVDTLRNNIRPIIHTGISSGISALTGIPLSGAVIGQLGLNNAVDRGLDKANLGFGFRKPRRNWAKRRC